VRLFDRVHLVGSGWLGYSLSDRHDSHVYLIDGGTESVLVDAGCGLAAATIAEQVRAVNAGPVTRILVTHGHADHSGGAGALAALLGARVCASAEVVRMLADADEEATGLVQARADGVYPAHLRLRPTLAEQIAGTIVVGDVAVTVLPTPGHAAGHLCFLARTPQRPALFTGDLVFARGRVAILDTPDTDVALLRRSIDELATLARDEPSTALLPGHGSFALTGAADHLAVAVDCFDRGSHPPPLLP
jgi:hydroxyacylglutathione hydrolase